MPNAPRGGGPPRDKSKRGRLILGIVAVVLVLFALSLRAIATFWTDFLWFESVDLTSVWSRLLSAKVSLGVATSLVFFILLWSNLVLADRLAPKFRGRPGGEDEILQRYREFMAGRQRLVWLVVALIISIIPGVNASSRWQEWLLFRHGGSFGIEDPQFGADYGWYMFQVPFLSMISDWLFAFLLVTAVATAVVHYLNGAIRVQPLGERVTQNAKIQLSVLLALAALVRAFDYWLQTYETVVANRAPFDGAGYTDIHATVPALRLMILVSIFAAVVLLLNIRRTGWNLAVIVVGLWVVVGVLSTTVYPAFVQRFQVDPAELSKETPYIERNISATRAALGMSEVEAVNFDYEPTLDAEVLAENPENLDNARLLDPRVIQPTIQDLQVEREYYTFRDVDVDRYELDGQQTPVVISSRELNLSGVTAPSWEKLHLVFTHGYAAALAPANRTDERGEPDFLVGGIPPRTVDLPPLTRPEIYFGERMDGYSIIGTEQIELSDDDVSTEYVGSGGVPIGSTIRRAAFALRFGQIDPLISDSITDESEVLYVRDVVERVQNVAPFLQTDPDPYPVLLDGRVQYLVDAYTTSSNYPYAEHVDAAQVDEGATGSFNYLRNSVKALVDAYDGTVTLYLTDELYGERDPIIRAYADALPDLFESEIPAEVARHFRYPEFLFKTQTWMWGRYHQSEASTFFNNTDRWTVATGPSDRGVGNEDQEATATEGPMDPYYQELRIGTAEDTEFVLTRPFVVSSGDGTARNLTSIMIARNDPENYGKLEELIMVSTDGDEVERNNTVRGPVQANRRMVTYEPMAEYQTFVGQRGTKIRLGNLLMLPIGDSIVYLRPVYAAEQSSSNRFTLQRVLVASGESLGFGDSVESAMADLLDSDPDGSVDGPPPEVDPDTPDPGDDPNGGESEETPPDGPAPGASASTPSELLAQADAKFTEADLALRSGDLAGYQRLVEEAGELVRNAASLLEAASAPPTTAADTPAG